MENKVLINLVIPTIEESFNIFIPVSKRVGNIIFLLTKAVNEIGLDFEFNNSLLLYNRNTGEQYDPNSLVYDTNIRNGSELVLL